MSKPTYIHYGHSEFCPNKFNPVRNDQWRPKPAEGSGMWASRLDDQHGWKTWCFENEFSHHCDWNQFFTFQLSDTANVLSVSSPGDLLSLPTLTLSPIMQKEWDESFIHPMFLDYEAIANTGIDAIELLDFSNLEEALYMWDCNCIFIMNPSIVEVCP